MTAIEIIVAAEFGIILGLLFSLKFLLDKVAILEVTVSRHNDVLQGIIDDHIKEIDAEATA